MLLSQCWIPRNERYTSDKHVVRVTRKLELESESTRVDTREGGGGDKQREEGQTDRNNTQRGTQTPTRTPTRTHPQLFVFDLAHVVVVCS